MSSREFAGDCHRRGYSHWSAALIADETQADLLVADSFEHGTNAPDGSDARGESSRGQVRLRAWSRFGREPQPQSSKIREAFFSDCELVATFRSRQQKTETARSGKGQSHERREGRH